jgi:purine-nucleoside phosphorylase
MGLILPFSIPFARRRTAVQVPAELTLKTEIRRSITCASSSHHRFLEALYPYHPGGSRGEAAGRRNMREDFGDRLDEASRSVRLVLDTEPEVTPRVAIVLGSGLGQFIDRIDGTVIPYSKISGFPVPTVEGHQGLLKVGKEAAILAGRFHLYEGCSMDEVVLPVFLLARLGVTHLVVTNAAGAINTEYRPGDLVLIRDHLNLMGRNPLVGPNLESLGPRFPDLSEAYSSRLRSLVKEAWDRPLAEGVYAALLGPTYETPAEIRMLRKLGADMVGMSTVPEVIAARFVGMEVLGVSCITNMAAGILDQTLSHEEVVETGRSVAAEFADLLLCFLEAFDRANGSPGMR